MGCLLSSHSRVEGTLVAEDEDWPWVWALRDPEILDWKNSFPSRGDSAIAQAQRQEELAAHSKKQEELPVPILEQKLFIGNAKCVYDLERLQGLGITAVLNMAGESLLHESVTSTFKSLGIKYMAIEADDEYEYPLLEKHWDQAQEFLDREIETGKVLCHCMAGMNRSGLIVSAYYMLHQKVDVLNTVKHVRFQRGNCALMNEGFQEQLVALARQHDLLGPKPGTEESLVTRKPRPPSPFRFQKRK